MSQGSRELIADPAGPRSRVSGLTLALAAALAVMTLLAFSPALDNGFVNWDDDKNFQENDHFRGLGRPQFVWAFTTFWLGVYRPLGWLLFSIQSLPHGLDPFVFHATGLALHVGNVLVLNGLTVAILALVRPDSTLEGRKRRALCAAMATALYAVHPLRVEPIAWASSQPYLPCAFFSLLSVWSYLKAHGAGPGPSPGWLAMSIVLFAAALLSHPVPIGLPAVLLILDVYPLSRVVPGPASIRARIWRRILWEKAPFAALGAVFTSLAIAARSQSLSSHQQSGSLTSLSRGCHGLWFYIAKTGWPRNLSAVYPAARHLDWWSSPDMPPTVATVVIGLSGLALRRRVPGLLACMLCYAAILGPNSGLVRVNDQIAADRYGYLSMMVWVIPCAWVLEVSWRRWKGRRGVAVAVTALVGVLVILVHLSRQQCKTWKNSETLWIHALTHSADASAVAHYNLGLALQRKGAFAEAASHYATSIRLQPDDAEAQNNLGVVLQRQGKLDASAACYLEAIRLKPDLVDPHYNLGTLLSLKGMFPEAEARYREALRLRPGLAPAYINLGADSFRQGHYSEAKDRFVEALRIDPGRADAHKNLGHALARLGNHGEAAVHFAEVLRLDPGYSDTRKSIEDVERTRRRKPAEFGGPSPRK